MNYRIPRTLDNSFRCLGIPMDTLIVFMMVWGSLMTFDKGLYGIPLGIFAANIFGRFRSRSIIRKIIRMIYWYLPCEMNFIKGVQGHQRKMSMVMSSSTYNSTYSASCNANNTNNTNYNDKDFKNVAN